jgi:hypothetical protein
VGLGRMSVEVLSAVALRCVDRILVALPIIRIRPHCDAPTTTLHVPLSTPTPTHDVNATTRADALESVYYSEIPNLQRLVSP